MRLYSGRRKINLEKFLFKLLFARNQLRKLSQISLKKFEACSGFLLLLINPYMNKVKPEFHMR